jgi:hypothetical protein
MMGVQVNSKFHNVGTMWLGTLGKQLFLKTQLRLSNVVELLWFKPWKR